MKLPGRDATTKVTFACHVTQSVRNLFPTSFACSPETASTKVQQIFMVIKIPHNQLRQGVVFSRFKSTFLASSAEVARPNTHLKAINFHE